MFAPTRSRLHSARLDHPDRPAAVDGDPVAGSTPIVDLSVSIPLPDPMPAGTVLDLRTQFVGEEPQICYRNWQGGEGWFKAAQSPDSIQRELYRKRSALADTSTGHAFCWELDRTTVEGYLRIDPSVTDAERGYRARTFGRLRDLMLFRLRQRFDQCDPQPAGERASVSYFSNLFWRATDKLYRDTAVPQHLADRAAYLGDVLIRFAAGWLRHDLKLEDELVPVSDPDSVFVFFFAEFASIAIEQHVHEEAWRALWPATVEMQRHYVERFADSDGDIEIEWVIDANYPKPPLKRNLEPKQYTDLAKEMHSQLRRLGKNGFGCV